jgi:hypothetical protein
VKARLFARLIALKLQVYAPQTKILEGGTKDEMRISKEALFNGSWPKLSTHALEKCFLRNRISSFVPPSKIFVWEGKVSNDFPSSVPIYVSSRV